MSEKLGEAFVAISANTKGLAMGLDKANKMTTRAIAQISRAAVIAFAATAAITVKVGKEFVQLASFAEESMDKASAVFKENLKDVQKWSNGLADSIGRSRAEVLDFAAGFQDLIVPMGYTRKEAAELSKGLVQVSLDLASFNNLADKDVINNVKSGMLGASRAVASLGANIKASALQEYLKLNFAIETNITLLSEAEKFMLRYLKIQQDSIDANQNAIITSDSFANTLKALQATLKNIGTTIGSKMLPPITFIFKTIKDGLNVLAADGTFEQWGRKTAEAITYVYDLIVGNKDILKNTIVKGFVELKKTVSEVIEVFKFFGKPVKAVLQLLAKELKLDISTTVGALVALALTIKSIKITAGLMKFLDFLWKDLAKDIYYLNNAMTGLFSDLKKNGPKVLSKVKDGFIGLAKSMKNTSFSFPSFKAFFKNLPGMIGKLLPSLKGLGTTGAGGIKSLASSLIKVLLPALTTVWTFVSTFFLPVILAIGTAFLSFKLGKIIGEWLVSFEAVQKVLEKIARLIVDVAAFFGGGDATGKKVNADMDERLKLIKDIKEAGKDTKKGKGLQAKFDERFKTNDAHKKLKTKAQEIKEAEYIRKVEYSKIKKDAEDKIALQEQIDQEAKSKAVAKELFLRKQQERVAETLKKKQKEAMGGIDSELFKFEKGEAASKRKELAKTLKEQLKLFADNEEAKIKVARLAAFKLAEINKETSASNKATSFTDFRGVVTSGQAAVSSIGAQASSKAGLTRDGKEIVSAIEKLIAKEEQNAKKLSNDNNRDY